MKRIVIVDDSAALRTLLRVTLQDASTEIVEAATADQAVDIVRGHPPEMIILDVQLGASDGLSVCRALREQPGLGKLRIIVMSGSATEQDVLDAGADRFLGKPFRPIDLRSMVDRLFVGGTN